MIRKVLFYNRSDTFTRWGGDTTQMLKTKEALEALGVAVDITLQPTAKFSQYDVLHIFNIQTAGMSMQQIELAKGKLAIVVSPIYWDLRHIEHDTDVLSCHQSRLARWVAGVDLLLAAKLLEVKRKLSPRLRRERQEKTKNCRNILLAADVLLPNSYAEAEILALLFDAPWVRPKTIVVPNAVETAMFASAAVPDCKQRLPERFILEVARFEPVKGQLRVLKALMDRPDIPLVFIGSDANSLYRKECAALAELRGNTWFFSEIPHEELPAFYRRAKVHVLPSLRESPGLSTLEAAASGCNCVFSFHAPVAEYFGTDGWCCDPCNIVSVRNAILHAWEAPFNSALQKRVLENFTWEAAAEKTLEAYTHITGAAETFEGREYGK